MKRIFCVFIACFFSHDIFAEDIKWEAFFAERLSISPAAYFNNIESKKVELIEHKAKTKWVPNISFNFPKIVSWRIISNTASDKKLDLLTGSYSLLLNQALPSNGNILFSAGLNYDKFLQTNEFKHTPSFSFQFKQPITKHTFDFLNETKKIRLLKEITKVKKNKTYADFIKAFLTIACNIEFLKAKTDYLESEYLHLYEQYEAAALEFEKGRIKQTDLLKIKQKMIEAKQDFYLNSNLLYLSEQEFIINYNYEYKAMKEVDKNSLITFLENSSFAFSDIEIQNTEYEILLLYEEKNNASIKQAPQINLGVAFEVNSLQNKFSKDYDSSWRILKNADWIPEIFVGISWAPDYTFTLQKEIDIIDLKISYADKKLALLRTQIESKHKEKALRIKTLKEDLYILSENLNLYLELMPEYKNLYIVNEITKSAFLEFAVVYSRQKYLKEKKFKELVSELF